MKFPFLPRLDEHSRDMLRGAALVFGMRATGSAMAFIFNVMLARKLGAEGAGVYFLAFTVVTIASVIGQLGLENAMMRFTAASAAKQDWETIAGICRRGIHLSLLASGALSIGVFLAAPWISNSLFNEPSLTTPLRYMALSIVPLSLLNLYAGLTKAVNRPGYGAFSQNFGMSLFNMLLLGGFYWMVSTVDQVAMMYVVSITTVCIISIWLWRKAAPQLRGKRGDFDQRRLMDTSLPLLWVSSMYLVMSWTDTLMLGNMMGSEAVGLYSIPVRIAMLTSFVLIAVNSVAAPKFSVLHAQGENIALATAAKRSANLMTIVALPILVFFVFWPNTILGFFGEEFVSASTVLVILSLGQFICVLSGNVSHLLAMTGHGRELRNIVCFSAVLNVILNVLLISQFGILGAAIATATCMATMNAASAFVVYRRLSINPLPNFLFLKASVRI